MTKDSGQAGAVIVGGDLMEPSPSPAPATSIKRLAVSGSLWTMGGFGLSQVLRLGGNLVMSHLLLPDAFGIMAIVNLVLQGLQHFSEVGIRGSIIYSKRGKDPVFVNTAWTIQAVRGIMLGLACCALAWPVSRFYHREQLMWLIPATGLNAVITGFFSSGRLILFRDLDVKTLTFLELAQQIGTIVMMFLYALIHQSVWAFVVGNIGGNLLMLVLTYAWAKGPPVQFCWNTEARKDLFNYGRWIFMSTVTVFLAGQFDKLFLGKVETMAVLGVYNIAGMLSLMPRQVTIALTSSVLQPAIAKLYRKEPEKLEAKVLRARSIIIPGGLFITLGIALFSPTFFHLLYNRYYAAAGWYSQLLSIAFWFMILQGSSDKALLAIGNSKWVAISNMVNAVVTIAGCYLGYHFAKWLGVQPITGLIIGTGVGNAAGQLVIEIGLYVHRVNIFRADILYTVLFFALTALGMASERYLSQRCGFSELAANALTATIITVPVGIWAARRTLRELL